MYHTWILWDLEERVEISVLIFQNKKKGCFFHHFSGGEKKNNPPRTWAIRNISPAPSQSAVVMIGVCLSSKGPNSLGVKVLGKENPPWNWGLALEIKNRPLEKEIPIGKPWFLWSMLAMLVLGSVSHRIYVSLYGAAYLPMLSVPKIKQMWANMLHGFVWESQFSKNIKEFHRFFVPYPTPAVHFFSTKTTSFYQFNQPGWRLWFGHWKWWMAKLAIVKKTYGCAQKKWLKICGLNITVWLQNIWTLLKMLGKKVNIISSAWPHSWWFMVIYFALLAKHHLTNQSFIIYQLMQNVTHSPAMVLTRSRQTIAKLQWFKGTPKGVKVEMICKFGDVPTPLLRVCFF